jgi:hypothetical protein
MSGNRDDYPAGVKSGSYFQFHELVSYSKEMLNPDRVVDPDRVTHPACLTLTGLPYCLMNPVEVSHPVRVRP